jgi:hypothetical protein
MNTACIHMVEVEGMDREEERPLNHRPEDESMDMVDECPSNHQPEVEGINSEDIDMVEDMMAEVRGGGG